MSPANLLYKACLLIPILADNSLILIPSRFAISFITPLGSFQLISDPLLIKSYHDFSYTSRCSASPTLILSIHRPRLIPARLIYCLSSPFPLCSTPRLSFAFLLPAISFLFPAASDLRYSSLAYPFPTPFGSLQPTYSTHLSPFVNLLLHYSTLPLILVR